MIIIILGFYVLLVSTMLTYINGRDTNNEDAKYPGNSTSSGKLIETSDQRRYQAIPQGWNRAYHFHEKQEKLRGPK
jgi:hypothetical protein